HSNLYPTPVNRRVVGASPTSGATRRADISFSETMCDPFRLILHFACPCTPDRGHMGCIPVDPARIMHCKNWGHGKPEPKPLLLTPFQNMFERSGEFLIEG